MSVLILRTCKEDGKSFNGFQWPLEVGAVVEAPDWNPEAVCGGGLHGLLWGCGDGTLLSPKAPYWLVCEADEYVDLDGKVKVPICTVLYVGDQDGAIKFLDDNGTADKPVVFSMRTAGYLGIAAAGDEGTATAGDYGTATAGDYGTATAGNGGTAMAGNCGTATAGDDGSATAGDNGTATAGDNGIATAGRHGAATAGEGGILCISWHDRNRRRFERAYVGEKGIKPNTPYRLDGNGNFVEAQR